jgi:hypothetical protein
MSNLGNNFYIDAKPGGGGLPPKDYTHGWYILGNGPINTFRTSYYTSPFDDQEEYDFFEQNFSKIIQRWEVTPSTPNMGNFDRRIFPADLNFKRIELSLLYCIGLTQDGKLWVWGSNQFDTVNRFDNPAEPLGGIQLWGVEVPGVTLRDFAFFSTAPANYYQIRSDGTLWRKGLNNNGLNGNGLTSGEINTYTQLGTDTDWLQICRGAGHVVALKEDGTVWTWGSNVNGATGLGTSVGSTNIPTQVILPTTVKKVDAHHRSTMVWGDDDNFYFWGGRGINNVPDYSGIVLPTSTLNPTVTVTSAQVSDLGITDYIMASNIFFECAPNNYKITGPWVGDVGLGSPNFFEAHSLYLENTSISPNASSCFVNSEGKLFTSELFGTVGSPSTYLLDSERNYKSGIKCRINAGGGSTSNTWQMPVFR